MPFSISYNSEMLPTNEVAGMVVNSTKDADELSQNINTALEDCNGFAVKKEFIKFCTQELKKKKMPKSQINRIISQTSFRERLNKGEIAKLIKSVRKQLNITASDAFRQDIHFLPYSLTLFEERLKHKNLTNRQFKKTIETVEKIRNLLPKVSFDKQNFLDASDPIDGHYNEEAANLRFLHDLHDFLEPLQLDHNSITKFSAFAPYLGRFTAGAPTSWMRRFKVVFMNSFARVFSYKAPRQAAEGVDRGSRAAKKFSKEHSYELTPVSYGGETPFELSKMLGATLSQNRDLHVKTHFELVHGDTVDNARNMYDEVSNLGEDCKMGIVNCANKDRVGGVWDIKRGSQEESLVRSSNLINALRKFKTLRRMKNHIPTNGAAYTPDVTFKDSKGEFNCDVSSVAAVDWRSRSSERKAIVKAAKNMNMDPKEYLKLVTKHKYAALLGSFLENQVTDVLISLPGLGSFNNDPDMVGEILKELFQDEGAPFKGKFQRVKINIFDPEKETASRDMVNSFIDANEEQSEGSTSI